MTTAPLPLAGIRVLDLSRVLAGPFCTMTLGDLGADIIKVERAGAGDETRGWGPPFDARGQSAYFLSTNRNKFSVGLDFRNPDDLSLLLDLAKSADVVVENFLPGALTKYGIDRGALLARNSRLIWCNISGFGENSSRPGYDFVVQAESGWMAIGGPPDGEPSKAGVALVDVIAGKDAASAVLAALLGRERGVPFERSISITLRRSATAALVNVAQNTLVSGAEAKRWGNAHANLVPYQLFAASDRPFVVAVGSDPQWLAAAKALGLGAMAEEEALRTNAGRIAARDRVVRAIADRVAGDTAEHWIDRLSAAGVPCGVVRSVREALGDVKASPETGIEPAVGGSVRYPPPLLDEHGKEIRKMQWSAFGHVPIPNHQGV